MLGALRLPARGTRAFEAEESICKDGGWRRGQSGREGPVREGGARAGGAKGGCQRGRGQKKKVLTGYRRQERQTGGWAEAGHEPLTCRGVWLHCSRPKHSLGELGGGTEEGNPNKHNSV